MIIGRLQQVPLREVWKHEEYDFSSWMALPENLELLSDEIGITLVNPITEKLVGRYSADIIAEEDTTGRVVLIENQLEASNHDHLGKLFTYGAGLNAEVIIWIVKDAREEHEQAINWINEHTDEQINIFLIQIEAWKIGESDPAPRLNVIAKPNDWAKMVKQAPMNNSRVVSEYNVLQQSYWDDLRNVDEAGVTGQRKTRPQHWFDVSIGRSNGHIALTVDKNKQTIGCELYIPKDAQKEIFDQLYLHKESIEQELSEYSLEWMRLETKTASRVKAIFPADIYDQDAWPGYHQWMIRATTDFKRVFPKYF